MRTITLFKLPGIYELPSLSPFSVKVETYLKMCGANYTSELVHNPAASPRKRLPYIKMKSSDGESTISDSHFILNELEKNYNLDSFLSQEQKDHAMLLRRILDQDFIRYILYSRWIDPNGWNVLKNDFKQFFPKYLALPILLLIRKKQIKNARGFSLHEYNQAEIYNMGLELLQCFERQVSIASPYLFGTQPSTADATLYAFISCIHKTPIKNPLRDYILTSAPLLKFCRHIESTFFRISQL